jgi:hypothetical protein
VVQRVKVREYRTCCHGVLPGAICRASAEVCHLFWEFFKTTAGSNRDTNNLFFFRKSSSPSFCLGFSLHGGDNRTAYGS